MNKYSKIKLVNSTTHTKKSRSIDFSDLTTFPQIITKPIESKPTINKTHNSPPNLEEQDQENPEQNQEPKNGDEGSFNLKLSRNSSVSSNTSLSHRFRFEKQSNPSSSTSTTTTTSLEDAVKRAFSVRRSSSVSERYCRIHDQCVSLSSPLDEDDDEEEEQGNDVGVKTTRSMGKKKKKKQSKILKACKRFFGL